MAKINEATVKAAFAPHLQPGETLQHWAYGVKQPNIFLIILLVLLAVLPGLIAVMLLTKSYLVGLTDERFLVLRFKGNLSVSEVIEYSRASLPPVKTSGGPVFTHIKISDPAKPFAAKFHRLGMAGNREHSQAIAAALEGRTLPADSAGATS